MNNFVDLSIMREETTAIRALYRVSGRLLLRGLEARPTTNLRALYRLGKLDISDQVRDMFRVNIRKDRRPTDTPDEIHELIEDWLIHHGFIARRSNSLFCTTDKNMAVAYGDVYVVFPIDGWQCTHFAGSVDLFKFISDYLESSGFDGLAEAWMDGVDQSVIDWLQVHMDEIMAVAQPIDGISWDGVENMISGNGAWLVKWDTFKNNVDKFF